jgi:saccharopine dehydrogenase-like NADP-dependent oxidoreductase
MIEQRAVVLGGAGEIGKAVVRDLAAHSSFLPVVVADYREAVGRAFVEALGSDRVLFERVDARDQAQLINIMRGATVVVNTIGPFYEWALTIATAAIHAGVHYVDVCDDPDATIALLALDPMARRKGLTFLICQGWTPGIMNLMAARGARQMDEVHEIRVNWLQDLDEEVGIAPLMHWGHVTVGTVPAYRDGQWVQVRGLSEREVVRFPEPIGEAAVFYTGHPEPVTLPRFLSARTVLCKGGLVPEDNVTLTRIVEALGLGSTPTRIRRTAKLFMPLLPYLSKIGGKTTGQSGSRVEIRGQRNGGEARVIYGMVLRVAVATGTSAAIGAQMIAAGLVNHKGVLPPEAAVDHEWFFDELAQRGLKLVELPS